MFSNETRENSKLKKQAKSYNSDLIYLVPELDDCKEKLKSKINLKNILIGLFTLLLFILCIVVLLVIKINDLKILEDLAQAISDGSLNETDLEEFNQAKKICDIVDFATFSIVSHPLAFLLIILYMFLFWRRSCCLNCFFRRPAPPMIIPPYKKYNRFYSAVIYGIISFNVMIIVQSAIEKSSSSDKIGKIIRDPSGLFKLLIKIVEVFVAALRYYPPLIAFNSNSFIIYLTSAFYMFCDLGVNLYVEGKCSSFDEEYATELDQIKKLGNGKIAFTIVKDAPHFFLLSFVCIALVYKTLVKLIKTNEKNLLIDEDIKFFSKNEIIYCAKLFKKDEQDKTEESKLKSIAKKIYKWDENFKFSSRILNAHVVAFVALYYFFMEWLYYGIIYINTLIGKQSDGLTSLLQVIGDFEIDFPIDPIMIKQEHVIGFIVSAVISLLICLVQTLLGLKGIKKSLLLGYKGKLQKRDDISNVSIATGNSHFTGFLVGFLLNGFLFIFAFLFAICILIYFLCQFASKENILNLFLKILPIIVVFVVKFIFNFICSKFIFLQQKGKYLALDNLRAYSIFLYVTFFFDCFVGVIAALVRFIIGIIGALLFMPRIGYSFLGSHLEKFDSGFKLSNGYINMEIAHSHPVLITFCALLYFKRLNSKQTDTNKYDLMSMYYNTKIHPNQKEEKSSQVKSIDELKQLKKQRIQNKWFLYVTLINNNSLIMYRKKEFSHNRLMGIYDYKSNLTDNNQNSNDTNENLHSNQII